MSEQASVTADTSGTVWKVNVAVGDAVADGDAVVVIEAMKMEIGVVAEVAGVVTAVLVGEGDVVEADQVLVELEV